MRLPCSAIYYPQGHWTISDRSTVVESPQISTILEEELIEVGYNMSVLQALFIRQFKR